MGKVLETDTEDMTAEAADPLEMGDETDGL
jgi:hypothetical protein